LAINDENRTTSVMFDIETVLEKKEY